MELIISIQNTALTLVALIWLQNGVFSEWVTLTLGKIYLFSLLVFIGLTLYRIWA